MAAATWGVYSVAIHVAELLWLLSWAVTVSAYSRIGTRDSAAAVSTTLRAVRLGLGAALAAAPLLGVAAWLAAEHLVTRYIRRLGRAIRAFASGSRVVGDLDMEGAPAEVTSDARVVEAYLGESYQEARA